MSPRLAKIICPTSELQRQIAFYADALGLSLRFADGDRYAEFAPEAVSLALVAGSESLAGTVTALAFAVDDIPEAIQGCLTHGGTVVVEPESGPHEIRAVLRDPAGHDFVLYAKST
jgi:predicted enzyme related to lactoylglutathione lyase